MTGKAAVAKVKALLDAKSEDDDAIEAAMAACGVPPHVMGEPGAGFVHPDRREIWRSRSWVA